ncbi:MAG: dihydroorotase [Geminicoccaceae bacterium]|nr:MAG: dihydroorotase [Geminicoccaceae bacterium]
MSRYVTLITGARLLDPASSRDAFGGVRIEDGRITDLGPAVTAATAPAGATVIDALGHVLAPGLVDMAVHFGEPGEEEKETFDSGSRAALAGGVTSLALLPDTDPIVDDPAMLEYVARRSRRVRGVKVHPMAALTRGFGGEQLAEIGLLREAGAVAFTDATRPLADSRVLRRALAYAKPFDALIVQRPEDRTLAPSGVMNEGAIATRLGLAGIPHCAELIMLERDLRLVELTGARYHASQLSTAAAVGVIRAAKARGLRVTCDVSPHHLTLNELEVEGYRTFAKVRPPLRTEADRQALVEGVLDGTIDAIASDHRPQDQDSKRLPFAQAAFGAIGVQTMLPVCLRLVHEGTIPLSTLLQRLTAGPAAVLGLNAGRLAVGAPGDLVLFDLEAPWKIALRDLESLAKNTPFEGRLVQGRVLRTFVDGREVFRFEDAA